MPPVFWMVTETDFGGRGETAVAGIFDSPAAARHFVADLQQQGPSRGTLSISQLPWSGADGGYIPGSERSDYRPALRSVPCSRPNCDFEDG